MESHLFHFFGASQENFLCFNLKLYLLCLLKDKKKVSSLQQFSTTSYAKEMKNDENEKFYNNSMNFLNKELKFINSS